MTKSYNQSTQVDTNAHTYINREDYTQERAHLPDLYVDEDALNVLTRQKPFKRFPKVLQK